MSIEKHEKKVFILKNITLYEGMHVNFDYHGKEMKGTIIKLTAHKISSMIHNSALIQHEPSNVLININLTLFPDQVRPIKENSNKDH